MGRAPTTRAKAYQAVRRHDLAAETFYHLYVLLRSGPGASAVFLGVDFPS